jgi:RimJ/RimL family protein N-acetyltransferase
VDARLVAEQVVAGRVRLDPLRVVDAEALAPLLDDPALHRFIGGEPATLEALRARFVRQLRGGPPDGSARWLNWVVRAGGEEVGMVQATVVERDAGLLAEVAWIVAVPYQGRGYARAAAVALAGWLRAQGVGELCAHIHPEHAASMGVARAIGLHPTDARRDGEVRWAAKLG